MNKTGIIYKAVNKINGKIYIGATIQKLLARKKKHEEKSKKNTYGFHGAIYKYGKENFLWEIVEECLIDDIDEREIFYIEKYNSYANDGYGYNLTRGGRFVFGASGKFHYLNKMSPEEKELWLNNNRMGKNNGMYGKGELISGKNHFLNKMSNEDKEKWLDENLRGDNNYQKKLSIEELKKKHFFTKMSDEEKEKWINKNLKGKNNPYVKHAYKYRGKNSPNYGKRGIKSPVAKKYVVIFPNDKKYVINLIEFCKSYIDVKLLPNGLNRVANGYIEEYKGFKCRHFNEIKDFNILEWKYKN